MPRQHIREHLLQLIWVRQYIHTDRLTTLDGRTVEVLSSGKISFEPGPDIRSAVVRIDGTQYTGDIEIHRTPQEWFVHGHDTDPAYNSVILHVLLFVPVVRIPTATVSGRDIPQIALHPVLLSGLDELALDAALDEQDVRSGRLACSGLNHDVPAAVIRRLLERLAVERVEIKLRRLEERLHQLAHPNHQHAESGAATTTITKRDLWEQLLYEGLMEGLGYTRNRRSFITLSHLAPLRRIRELTSNLDECEALLFGISGLLDVTRAGLDADAGTYVHTLMNTWKHLRMRYSGETMRPFHWKVGGRPGNSFYLRIMAGSVLSRRIIKEDLFVRLLQAVRGLRGTRKELHRLLFIQPNSFWERRVSFSRVVTRSVSPLGVSRRDDLIINIIVPLFLLYARMFHDAGVRKALLEMVRSYPSLQPNGATRRIRSHLVRDRFALTSAMHQQGAIQLFNYYCKDGRCRECEIGRRVWGQEYSGG